MTIFSIKKNITVDFAQQIVIHQVQLSVAAFHGRFERATDGTQSPPVQREATTETPHLTRFTDLLLVRSCIFLSNS